MTVTWLRPECHMPRLKHTVMRHAPHTISRNAVKVFELQHTLVTRHIRRALGLRRPGLAPEDLRHTDTVFLLGTGRSINNISQQRLAAIAAHDSMGLNFWIRHPLIPRIYFVEAAPPEAFDRLVELAWRREQDYKDVVKIVTTVVNQSPLRERQLSKLPPSWLGQLWPVDGVTMFARNPSELRQELSRPRARGLFADRGPVTRLFKYMGTMTSMISLAVRMGYRNIVLCGVDLSTPGHFHNDPERYPDMRGFSNGPPTRRHLMLADGLPHCGADQVIYALADMVLRPRGVSLYVENDHSALYPIVPVAPDALFES